METIVIFQSDRFDRAWRSDVHPGDIAWGQDCAALLMTRLAEKGIPTSNREPIAGEGGWWLLPKLDNHEFSVFVHWVPIGEPPQDYWCLQIGEDRSLFSRLLKKPRSRELAAICSVIRDILEDEAGFENVQWLTTEQFGKIY